MLVFIYNSIPKSVRNRLGKSKALKGLRDLFLKRNGVYKERTVVINRAYLKYNMSFKYTASIKDAARALKYGIENTMLRNSIELIRRYDKDLDGIIVMDIGANFGYLTTVWAKSICHKGKVIAFEPNKHVFETLKKTIVGNSLNDIVKAENLAVGNENKDIDLFLNNTTSNVLQISAHQKSEVVQMIRIDEYIKNNNLERCDLIKIDVDGIELDILKGSLGTLKQLKPIFIVETNDNFDLVQFFVNNNYQVLNERLEVYELNDFLPPNIYCVPNT